jgi:hypothetical protein
MARPPQVPEGAEVAATSQQEPGVQAQPANSLEHGADRGESIARRAYERFEMRGREHGRDQDDWLAAEEELNNSQND